MPTWLRHSNWIPTNVPLIIKCSQAHLHSPKVSQRDRGKALELAKRAVSLAPDNAAGHLCLARAYSAAKYTMLSGPDVMFDSERALEHFNRAVALAPNSAEHLTSRAGFFNKTHDFDRALRDLDRALEIDPDQQSALRHRANILVARGDFDAAMRDLEHVRRLVPHSYTLYPVLAEACMAQEKWNEALDAWTRAIDIRPGYWMSHKRRATVHAELGQYDSAIDDLKAAFMIHSGDPSVLWMNVKYAKESLEFRRALLEFADEVVQSCPAQAVAYNGPRPCLLGARSP